MLEIKEENVKEAHAKGCSDVKKVPAAAKIPHIPQ